MSEPDRRRPVRRALISVYDKAGLLELATGLHALGVEIVSTGSTAQRIADAGVPVTPGRAADRLPGVPRRAGQDPAPAGARRAARRHPQARAPRAARRAGHRPVRPAGVEPLPVHRRRWRPARAPDECVEQIDIGGPAMVRASAKNHDSVAVVVDPTPVRLGAGAGQGRRVHAGRPAPAGRRGVPAHRDLRRRRRVLDGQRAGARARRRPVPGLGRRHLGARRRRCATARTRTRPPRCTRTGGGGLAGAEQLHGKEMSYNNYVDADAAWRAAHDHDDALRRDHQARQPVRDRGRRRRRRGAPQGARHATRSARSAA